MTALHTGSCTPACLVVPGCAKDGIIATARHAFEQSLLLRTTDFVIHTVNSSVNSRKPYCTYIVCYIHTNPLAEYYSDKRAKPHFNSILGCIPSNCEVVLKQKLPTQDTYVVHFKTRGCNCQKPNFKLHMTHPNGVVTKVTEGTIYSDLEGHPTPRLNFIDVGSLGKGVAVACGKPLGDKADEVIKHVNYSNVKLSQPPAYKIGESVATSMAYGTALAKIAANNPRVIALDADTKNSTFADKPDRYIECFIAEQNLVGVAIAAACRDRTIAFVSTFATFFTRAFDQIRMGAISQANVNFIGSHCGVSIGEDRPTQMGLEDIALFRTIPGSTIFYPSDAVSCERAVELAANTKGICFIRTSRPNTAVMYGNDEKFEIGKLHVIKQSPKDQVLFIGTGITFYEALNAANQLEKTGVHARVVDLFTIKPIDRDGIIENVKECGGRIVTVEDHYKEGGIGEAVMSEVADQRFVVKQLAVPTVPRSGPPTVLLDMFGISARHIVAAATEILKL